MRKLVVAIVTCASALAAILALWLANLDIARYRGLIEEQASRTLGRRVAIAGELGLALSLRPTLVASGVTIANPSWASRPDLARVERVEATAALLPLLAWRVEIDRLRVDGADIRLERSADGQANWRLGRRSRASLLLPGLIGTAQAADFIAVPADAHIGEMTIRDSDIAYWDGPTGRRHRLRLARSDLAARDPVSPVEISASGELDGAALQLRGSVGPLADLLAEAEDYPVDLDIRWLGLDARMRGTLDIGGDADLDLAVDAAAGDVLPAVEHMAAFVPWLAFAGVGGPIHLAGRVRGSVRAPGIEDLRLTTRLFGVDVRLAGGVGDIGSLSDLDLAFEAEGDPAGLRSLAPRLPIGALRATGQAVGGASALMLRDLAVRLGRTDLSGEVTLLRHGDRPKVIGRIGSDRLSLPVGAGQWPAGPMLDAAVLGAVDADLRVETDRLVLGPVEAREVSLDVTLADGVLRIDRLDAAMAGSRLEGAASLDATEQAASLRLDAAPFDPGTLLAALGRDGLLTGRGNLHVDLQARGGAPDTWLNTLNGKIEIQIDGGTIGIAAIDALLGRPGPPADIDFDCLDLRLAVAEGIARSEVMRIDGEAATAEATGAIDLARGRFDLAITATPKAGDLAPTPPIGIAGSFDDPRIAPVDPEAADQIAGLLAQLLVSPAMGPAIPGPPATRGGCDRSPVWRSPAR